MTRGSIVIRCRIREDAGVTLILSLNLLYIVAKGCFSTYKVCSKAQTSVSRVVKLWAAARALTQPSTRPPRR
jgi:hypothetical protein